MNPGSLVRKSFIVVAAGALLTSAATLSACGDDDDDGGAVATAESSQTFKVGAIEVSNVVARASDGETSAVYMMIKNAGPDDTLLSASTSAARETQIHETITDGSTMKMQQLKDGAAVRGDGQVLELKPGGYHVMLMGLISTLQEGDTIKVTLDFEKAGKLEVTAPVVTTITQMGQ